MTERKLNNCLHKLNELDRQKKELEKQIDALKDEVKAYMDEEGKELEETGDFVVRYATIHLTRFDTTRFKKEQEALYLAYLTQATQRRFTFKTKGVA